MADFRKIFYALAMVTLLAGLSAPAFAAGPLRCDASGVTPPFIRTEGHTELVGEVLINCTGGVSTTPGAPVPRVNIRVRLTTNITSKLLATVGSTNFNEVLLIIDEPNSGRYVPNEMLPGQTGDRPLLACGDVGAPDTSAAGPNVCDIIAPNHPSRTYDGTRNGYYAPGNGDFSAILLCDGVDIDGPAPGGPIPPRPAAGTFGCGRPNVFQGHQVTGNSNMVEFNGVPFDPPGDALFNSAQANANFNPWVRTLRVVNLRTDANAFFVAGNNSAIPILADVSFSGNTQAGIDDPRQLVVAYATSGITGPVVSGVQSFVQCVIAELPSLTNIASAPETLIYSISPPGITLPSMFVRFGEGFSYSWKTRDWAQMQANSVIVNGDRQYAGTFATPSTYVRQNVPGGIAYHTESGFTAPLPAIAADPVGQNPPLGVGTVQVSPAPGPLASNQTIDNSTDIENSGTATNGTRLQIKFSNIPTGVTLYTPEVVYLTRKGTNVITGIGVRNQAVNPVLNAYSAPASPLPTDWIQIGSSGAAAGLAVYEIMYADANTEEDITVPVGLTTVLNSLPQTIDVATTVNGGFAPSHTSGAGVALFTSDPKGQIPRFFENLTGGQTLFTLVKCNCNLLFPFVSNNAGFDTGIAIANTSLSPTDPTFTQTLAQSGPVQFWYFQNGALARTECTNATAKGVCPGVTFVPSGGVLTFSLARATLSPWGLNGPPAGFTGYMIAKAGFQYCHGFAYFSDLDRLLPGPGIAGTSVGYLALVMDPSTFSGTVGNLSISVRNATPRTVNTTADGLNN